MDTAETRAPTVDDSPTEEDISREIDFLVLGGSLPVDRYVKLSKEEQDHYMRAKLRLENDPIFENSYHYLVHWLGKLGLWRRR